MALLGADEPWGPGFTKAVYRAEFGEGRSISDPKLVEEALSRLGLDAGAVMVAAQSDGNKARLKAQCEDARELGVFGAPTFITPEGEMFWGNDRLERAMAWAAAHRS